MCVCVCAFMGSDPSPINTREILDVQMVWNTKWGSCFFSIGPILNWSVKLKDTESRA